MDISGFNAVTIIVGVYTYKGVVYGEAGVIGDTKGYCTLANFNLKIIKKNVEIKCLAVVKSGVFELR